MPFGDLNHQRNAHIVDKGFNEKSNIKFLNQLTTFLVSVGPDFMKGLLSCTLGIGGGGGGNGDIMRFSVSPPWAFRPLYVLVHS